MALAAKERDDRFCIACHLHEQKLTVMTTPPPGDLVGLHHQKEGRIGCIACHGGADATHRATVWAFAAFDTLKFLVARYEEPKRMQLPLRDAECRQCHNPIMKRAVAAPAAPPSTSGDPGAESTFAAEAETDGRSGNSYHALRDHDGVNIRCVRCHTSHTTGSDATKRFIAKETVQPLCRQCHKNM